jgi:hypothetical protein
MEFLTIENIVTLVLAVIGAASGLVKILESVTKVHPNERLDSAATKGRKVIAKVENVLDKLALNPRG